jgi:hypothetical protein
VGLRGKSKGTPDLESGYTYDGKMKRKKSALYNHHTLLFKIKIRIYALSS